MKTLITTLNAKYIHTSLAVRWLYTVTKDTYDVSFKEYTIKEKIEDIIEDIQNQQIDVLGLGVYIWNVEHIKKMIPILKKQNPNLVIILGGPEVSYEPGHFIETLPIDYVISGEGEFVFKELLGNILNQTEVINPSISYPGRVQVNPAISDIHQLETYDSPYMLEVDKPDLKHRLTYFETSRGCPYQCQYCLSSLEKGVRYFSQPYIEAQLRYLGDNGARSIKFLDRTFNLNDKHAKFIFQIVKDIYRPTLECHFEIYADLMSDAMIEYLNTQVPKNYFRFEIGIQSTYEKTNREVRRIQNFEKIRTNVLKLMEVNHIVMHLDLIAGLPYESRDRFIQSFNEVYKMNPEELQLGFLKLLRGTGLRKRKDQYGYQFNEASPYEITQSNWLSKEDVEYIKIAEEMLERYHNSGRFKQTLKYVFEKKTQDYLQFFNQLGQYYIKMGYQLYGYQLSDLYHAMYSYLQTIGVSCNEALFLDYYSQFKVKPKRFMEATINNEDKKIFIKKILNNQEMMQQYQLNEQLLYKYAYYEKIKDNHHLIILYLPNQGCIIHNINETT